MFSSLRLLKKYYLGRRQASGPVQQYDFDMHSQRVNLDDYIQRLKSSHLQSKTLQTVTYKNKTYPITQLEWRGAKAKKKLLIFASVHGNEFAAALAVPELLDDMGRRPDFYQGWEIRILTPINPVGLAYNSRYNESGHDINRDFKLFRTMGAQIQRDAVLEFNPDMVISLHEGPQNGFFMFSEGKLPGKLRKCIVQQLRSNNVALAEKSFFHVKLQSGIWEKPPVVYFLQRLLRIYTLGRFMYDRRIPTITTESAWSETDIEKRVKPHIVVIGAVVRNF